MSSRPAAVSKLPPERTVGRRHRLKARETSPCAIRPRVALSSSMEEDGLSDRQSTAASDGAVDSRGVLVRANDRLEHLRRRPGGVGIEIHHRTANIPHREGDGGALVPLTEGEDAPYPLILLEGHRPQGADHNIRPESPHVRTVPREASDLAHRIEGDHGDTRFIEDAMIQPRHLHRRPMAATDLGGQVFAEDGHPCPIRRANMGWKVLLGTVVGSVRSKQQQSGKLARGQPGEPAPVVEPPERETPVAVEAVPAQCGGLESFAAHGLHRIPVDRLDVSNLNGHAGGRVLTPQSVRDRSGGSLTGVRAMPISTPCPLGKELRYVNSTYS